MEYNNTINKTLLLIAMDWCGYRRCDTLNPDFIFFYFYKIVEWNNNNNNNNDNDDDNNNVKHFPR